MRYLLVAVVVAVQLYGNKMERFAQKKKYYRSYDQALSIAVRQDKPLLLFMVTPTCSWCRNMERRTLSKRKVNRYIQEHFIPVLLNVKADAFPKQFETPRTPTVFFVDPKGEGLFWESIGFQKRRAFSKTLEEALHIFEKSR